MTPIAKIIITPLSRETIARMTISAIASPVSAFKRIVVSALLMLMITSMQAQNVGDFLVNEKIASTGRVTLRSWPKGANTLWGTDANSLPQKITLGAGLTLSGTTLSAAGGSWSSITGKPTTLSGFGITDGITAAAAAAAYSPLNHAQAISTVTGLQTTLDTKANIVAGTAGVAEQVQINFSGTDGTQLGPGYYILLYDTNGSVGVWWSTGFNSVPSPGFDPSRWVTVPINVDVSADVDLAAATASALDSDAAFVASAGGTSVNYALAATGDVSDAEQGNASLSLTVVAQGQADSQDALAAYDGSNLTGLALANHSHDFSDLLNKPTTLFGYGITDSVLLTTSNLNAANLTGTINTARLGTGTASASTYLRGDGTWATVSGGVSSITGTANQITVTGTATPTLSLPATITGLTSVTSTTFVGALTGTASGNAALTANAFVADQTLLNSTAATNGTQQISPNLVLEGRGWATLVSQSLPVKVRQSAAPIQGTMPTAVWRLQFDKATDNSWPTFFAVSSAGAISTSTTNTLTLGTDPRLSQGSTARPIELATTLGAVTIFDGGANGQRLAFSPTAGNTSPTTQFVSIASAAISQRSGTTAQSFSVAKTWTSATNFEHGVMDWQTTTDVLRIGSSKGSGGGSNREVRFIMGDTAKITLDTAGNVILSGLPTTAPATSGALWRDAANGNVLKVVP
jgi:hypothetical protein